MSGHEAESGQRNAAQTIGHSIVVAASGIGWLLQRIKSISAAKDTPSHPIFPLQASAHRRRGLPTGAVTRYRPFRSPSGAPRGP